MHVITGMKSLVEHDLIMRAYIYTIRVQRVKIIHTNSIANVKLMLNNVAYVTSPKSHKYCWLPGTVCESATPLPLQVKISRTEGQELHVKEVSLNGEI